MKNFFNDVLSSFIGSFVAFGSVAFLFLLIIGGMIASTMSEFGDEETVEVDPNSILELKLNYGIPDRSEKPGIWDVVEGSAVGLNGILDGIRRAKDDKSIRGIYLNLDYIPNGLATIEEIRNELISFKQSDKFIIAYGEVYTQKAYYLASVADSIFLNPSGMLEFKGFGVEMMFLKGTLEKLDIEMQVVYAGKFKSATEPLRLDSMSDANRLQTRELLYGVYDHFLKNISQQRDIPTERLHEVADQLLVRHAEDAVTHNLVDKTYYEDEVWGLMRNKLGLEENEKIEFVSMRKYAKGASSDNSESKKIAIIYAEGDIVDGKGSQDNIGSEPYAKAIREARLDDDVKAIVLRINSPGGSALASDVMWRETVLAQQEKPLVVSMGNVAASGGYFMACAADKIVAQPNTITGSIGVFFVLPNFQDFFKEKLGITFDTVSTGQFSNGYSVSRRMTDAERTIAQNQIDVVYQDFLKRVSDGRGMDIAMVDSLAQGRVYTGVAALENGLVDQLGGLDDALKIAADLAKLDEYGIKEYPKSKDKFEQIMEDFGQMKSEGLEEQLKDYPHYTQLKYLMQMNNRQARLPFYIEFK